MGHTADAGDGRGHAAGGLFAAGSRIARRARRSAAPGPRGPRRRPGREQPGPAKPAGPPNPRRHPRRWLADCHRSAAGPAHRAAVHRAQGDHRSAARTRPGRANRSARAAGVLDRVGRPRHRRDQPRHDRLADVHGRPRGAARRWSPPAGGAVVARAVARADHRVRRAGPARLAVARRAAGGVARCRLVELHQAVRLAVRVAARAWQDGVDRSDGLAAAACPGAGGAGRAGRSAARRLRRRHARDAAGGTRAAGRADQLFRVRPGGASRSHRV